MLQLQVPLSETRILLFAEEDRRAFFLVGSVLDLGAPIAVLVVCIRVGASHHHNTRPSCGQTAY